MHHFCEGVLVIACVCSLRLCLQSGCAKASTQSQSSHLPTDRLEIEAAFAQLTPSNGQNKHSAPYTYTYICHSSALWTFTNKYNANTCKLCLTCIVCKRDIKLFAAGSDVMKMARMNIRFHDSHYLPVCQ